MPSSVLAVWGLTVDGLWAAGAQALGCTHGSKITNPSWVQSYRLMRWLYQKSTQAMHRQNLIFQSVIFHLYPLSTQPIKTTTNYMKGF